MEKIVILGNGVAGLTAAVYAGRAMLSPLVINGPVSGGQLTLTNEIENFPGFSEGVQGSEIINKIKVQAEKFGTKFKEGVAINFDKVDGGYKIKLSNEEEILTESLIVATGSSPRWLGLESERKFKGKGVGTCAICDGFFYKNKTVVVVGGGNSAIYESLFLTKFAEKVIVVHRRDELRASKIMQDRFFKNPKTDVVWDSEVKEILGDEQGVIGVRIKNKKSGEEKNIDCHGVFLALGHVPNTSIFKEKVDLDDHGYIKTNRYMETSLEGVFAAGDVQEPRFRQAVTAAGSGAMAAMKAEEYLENKKE